MSASEAPAVFKNLPTEQDQFFESANLREKYSAEHSTMGHTTLQIIYRLVSFKRRMETTRGTMGAREVAEVYAAHLKRAPDTEAPTNEFVDAALTVHNRLLSDQVCQDVLLAIEKIYPHKGPLNSVYKLEGIVRTLAS